MQMQAQVNIITTISGNDTEGFTGDGGLAIKAKLNRPDGICLDKWSNLYLSDAANNRIRKINLTTGIITTVAGNSPAGGIGGFSGDCGLATNAQLWAPTDVFTDTLGNIYIADAVNNRIRKVTVSTGIITTVAGSGPVGSSSGSYSGDGDVATNATLNEPSGLCLDNFGNIYIADISNHRVRKVEAATGIITTVAGTGTAGYSGDGDPATNAKLSDPIQVFLDSSGNIFFTDIGSNVMRKISVSTGIIVTIAGTGLAGYSGDNGPASNAALNQPVGIYIDKQQNIFIAEYGNGTIRKINALTGIIITVAGCGTFGYMGDGGLATVAELKCEDLCFDKYGTMYIADYENNRIRMVRDTTLRVGVASVAFTQKEVKVFPNPVKDELTITGIEQSTTYQLLDITGTCLLQGTFGRRINIVSMQKIISGVYLLEMTGNNGERTIVRVIKE